MGETSSHFAHEQQKETDEQKIKNVHGFLSSIRSVVRDRKAKNGKLKKKQKRSRLQASGHKRRGSNFSVVSTASAPSRPYSSSAFFEFPVEEFPEKSNFKHTRNGSNSKHKRNFSTASAPSYSQSAWVPYFENSQDQGTGVQNNAPVVKRVEETKVNGNAEFTQPDSSDLSKDALYNPDLATCCQTIATFFAEALASNNTSDDKNAAPTAEHIYGYMRMLFNILKLEPECCVVADIYCRRLLSNSKGKLRIHSGNWKKVIVGACLLASKYVDDESVQNSDVSVILTGCSLEFMNKLESKFLEILNWQLYVPLSEYIARYSELAKKKHAGAWEIDYKVIRPHFTVGLRTSDCK